ncbi:MAG: SDR family oxidoreductase, partial [archaeon]|nr:SDR family oxidoreductase [archaeon]
MAQTAVVTGASNGIGLELSKILAREGYDLVLAARSTDKLERLRDEILSIHNVNITVVTADLTLEEDRLKLMDSVPGDIDILVNNAGFGDYGLYAECDWKKQERMVNLNVLALSHLTHMVLPRMIARKSGRILNVGSVASFQPGPLMSTYYATKAYVLSMTEALSVELKGTGVTITALCPGPVNTGFTEAANVVGVSLFKKSSGADARDVAEIGYRAMMKGKVIAINRFVLKLLVVCEKILPRSMVRKIVYNIQSKR